jgi:hypothetical protein
MSGQDVLLDWSPGVYRQPGNHCRATCSAAGCPSREAARQYYDQNSSSTPWSDHSSQASVILPPLIWKTST